MKQNVRKRRGEAEVTWVASADGATTHQRNGVWTKLDPNQPLMFQRPPCAAHMIDVPFVISTDLPIFIYSQKTD